jgi:hypothetical protein
MKVLNITFTDAEYKRLVKARNKYSKEHNTLISWHNFILRTCASGISIKKRDKLK